MAMTDSSFGQKNADIIRDDFQAKYGYKPTTFRTQAGEGARLVS